MILTKLALIYLIIRAKDTNLCLAITDKIGVIKCYVPNKNLISPEITTDSNFAKNYKKRHGSSYESINIESISWNFFEKKYLKNIKKVDLLKIDIEGSDFKVLKSINLIKFKPKVIMVEAPNFEKKNKEKILNYLKLRKYSVIYDNNLNIILKKNI